MTWVTLRARRPANGRTRLLVGGQTPQPPRNRWIWRSAARHPLSHFPNNNPTICLLLTDWREQTCSRHLLSLQDIMASRRTWPFCWRAQPIPDQALTGKMRALIRVGCWRSAIPSFTSWVTSSAVCASWASSP